MSVSEETAKRIADALERLAKVMEGDPAIPPPYATQPTTCITCGSAGPFHRPHCPMFTPTAHNGDWP